jgi:hypothetical protein
MAHTSSPSPMSAQTPSEYLQRQISELTKVNESLRQETKMLQQQLRELQIQRALPDAPTASLPKQYLPEPVKSNRLRHGAMMGAVILALVGVAFGVRWFVAHPIALTTVAEAPSKPNPSQGQVVVVSEKLSEGSTKSNAPKLNIAPEVDYLVVEDPTSPNDPDAMVRVRNGFHQKSKEVARVNIGVKFKIRAQSPQLVTRQITINGENQNIEDYCYKISDKEQWIFGYFTNRRRR